jgi:hypothetical protein
MHLLVDISAHGLGHLAQTAPVVDALAALLPGLRLTVRSALPRERLAGRIAADFDHVMEARDFGYVMHNAVDIDLAASARRYREFHADWDRQVADEAGWLRRHAVDALLCNVAYLPLAAAAGAGIPAAGLCSLNWADLFAHYFAGEPWMPAIHAQMLAAYDAGRCFLRITPGLPMTDLRQRQEVAPIARPGQRSRARMARMLGLKEDDRWILLAMGGMEFPLPVGHWPHSPGVSWLAPGQWAPGRRDVNAFDAVGLDFSDLLSSVDAVITKPGYGTFVEAAAGGIPVLYLERRDWPETRHLADWLGRNARAAELTREQLTAGDFLDLLQDLWRRPAPALPPVNGADDAARRLVQALGLD